MANPPKMEPQRGSRGRGVLVLPAGGRKGEPPDWPLTPALEHAEWKLWRELWASPQAVEWERLGWSRVVARYVRYCLMAEGGDEKMAAEARQLEDRLGLTPKAMRLLLWTVAVDEMAEKREENTTAVEARKKFRAVG